MEHDLNQIYSKRFNQGKGGHDYEECWEILSVGSVHAGLPSLSSCNVCVEGMYSTAPGDIFLQFVLV